MCTHWVPVSPLDQLHRRAGTALAEPTRRGRAHALKVSGKVAVQGALKVAVATQGEPTVTNATGALNVAGKVAVAIQNELKATITTQRALTVTGKVFKQGALEVAVSK